MKKLIFILMLALAAGAAQAQVKFETKSTDAVREMAVKTGKLVFIDLYATWCPPCRTMEREVFSRKDVGDFMEQHFVAAKYDVDKTTGKELLKRYGSGAIPLYLVFDTQGELLGRIQGAAKPDNGEATWVNDPRQTAAAQTGKYHQLMSPGGAARRCTSQRLTAATAHPAIRGISLYSRSEKAREFIMMHSPRPQQARHGSDVAMTGT